MHICQNVVKRFYLGEKLEYQQENEEHVDGKVKFWSAGNGQRFPRNRR